LEIKEDQNGSVVSLYLSALIQKCQMSVKATIYCPTRCEIVAHCRAEQTWNR